MKWPIVKLCDVAQIERDTVIPTDILAGTIYIGLEHIEAGGRILNPEIVEEGKIASNKFRFDQNHILYGKLRPYLAKIAMPNFAGVCSTDILPILSGPKLDKRYLAYFLRQPRMVDYAASRAEGANLPRLSPKTLAEFEIPLPPLDEQRLIASILDQADNLRRLRERAIDRLNDLGQAIFREMFCGLKAEWHSEQVDNLCDLVRGSSPRPQGDPRFFGGPVPRLMIADITRDGMIVTPRIDSLTDEGAKRSRPMPAGSVVMAVSGAVGLPAILATDACIHDGFVGFGSLTDKIDPVYFYYYLLENRKRNRAKGVGAIWVNLTTDQVKGFQVPVPPMKIQCDFKKRLLSLHALGEKYAKSASVSMTMFSSLQHRAFNGQL